MTTMKQWRSILRPLKRNGLSRYCCTTMFWNFFTKFIRFDWRSWRARLSRFSKDRWANAFFWDFQPARIILSIAIVWFSASFDAEVTLFTSSSHLASDVLSSDGALGWSEVGVAVVSLKSFKAYLISSAEQVYSPFLTSSPFFIRPSL